MTIGSEKTCDKPSKVCQLSNRVYEQLSATDHCFIGQHFLAHAFYAVAILKIKFPVAQFKNTDVGFAAGTQRAGSFTYRRTWL